jgi:hypothetical protein
MASLEVRPIFFSTASAPRFSSGSTRARTVAVLAMVFILDRAPIVAQLGYNENPPLAIDSLAKG